MHLRVVDYQGWVWLILSTGVCLLLRADIWRSLGPAFSASQVRDTLNSNPKTCQQQITKHKAIKQKGLAYLFVSAGYLLYWEISALFPYLE